MADPWPGKAVEEWPGTPVKDWPGAPEKAAAPEEAPETSLIRDIPGSLVAGVGSQIVKLPGQVYGLATGDWDTAPMRAGKAVEEFGRGMMSPGLRTKQAQVQAAIRDAEERGLGAEIVTTLKGYLSDPYLLANFAVEQLPSLIATVGVGKVAQGAVGIGAKVAQRAAPAVETLQKTGQLAAIGTGAAMQGGSVAEQTYDQILGQDDKIWTENPEFNSLVNGGMTPDQAKQQIAASNARLAGVAGGIVSAVTGGMGGAEKAAFGPALAGGAARRVATTAGKEALQEAVEEGAGQFAQNVAVADVNPAQSLTGGIGSQATLGALGGAGPGAVVGALHGEPRAPMAAPVEPEAAPVPAPKEAPEIDTPMGFRGADGSVAPIRVMEYFDQDGETFARVVPETAPEAAPEPAFVMPLADLQAGVVGRAPEPVGARFKNEPEPFTQEDAAAIGDEAEAVREGARARKRGPELDVATRQGAPHISSLSDDQLAGRIATLENANRNAEEKPEAALYNLTMLYGMSPEEAQAAVERGRVERDRRIGEARQEQDRRGTVAQQAPELDPLAGVTPLLRARPEVSEAETGSLTRPRAAPAQGELAPVARSEAETGSLTLPKPPQKPAQKATTLLGLIRSMGINPADKNTADLVEALGYSVRRTKEGRLARATLPGLVRKNGASVDAIREAAEEAGIIGAGGKEFGTTDIGDLINAAGNAKKLVAQGDINAALDEREQARMRELEDQYGVEPQADAVSRTDADAVADIHEEAHERAYDAYANGDFELEPSGYLDEHGGDLATPSPENLTMEEANAEPEPARKAREQPATAPEVPQAGREAGPETGPAGEGEEAGRAAGASRENAREGTAYEPAPASVAGGGEQGVLAGLGKSAKQAQAARDAKGGLRSGVAQEKPGGIFDETPDTGSLFERGTLREEAAQREIVAATVRQILGPQVRMEIVDRILNDQDGVERGATGRFNPNTGLLQIAAYSPDRVGTARHEALHALRSLGVISPDQWKVLSDEATKTWRDKHRIDSLYTPENTPGPDGEPLSAERLEEVRNEEAVAAEYASWLRGDSSVTGKIKAAFERIKAFFESLRARLWNHPETVRSIFRDMDAGRMAPFASRAMAERFGDAVTTTDMGAGMTTGQGPQTTGDEPTKKEARGLAMYNRLPPEKKSGPRWLSMPTRIMSFPLARAATDKLFAGFTTPMLQSQKRASAITRSVQDGMEPLFRLPEKEFNSARQALELISLNNAFPPVINGQMTVRNESGKIARLTGPKRIVRLTPEATKAMLEYKKAMDGAWDAYAAGAVKAVTGYTGDMTPQSARAASDAARARNNNAEANDADTAAAILEAAQDAKRHGYYPAMREGDTQIVVRKKLSPAFAAIIGKARARGYPKGEALTAARLDEFLNAAQKPADVRFWSELRSDFDDARAKARVAEGAAVNDDMIWNEHFYQKPPITGTILSTTQAARNRRVAEKTAEVTALMEKRGIDMAEHEVVVRPVREAIADQITDQSIPVMEKLLFMSLNGNQAEFQKVWAGMSEQIRKNTVSSFRRRSQVVPGFSMDIGDTLSRYSHAVGSVASKLEYRKTIDEALDAIINNPDVNYDPAMKGKDGYAARLKEYVNDGSNDFNALKSFGFMYYMAGVPSTAVQNMTQIPMVALPQMAGVLGPRSAGIMGNAWQQSLRALRIGKDGVRMDVSKLGRTDGERAFIDRMDREGQITASVTRDLMGRDVDVGPELKAAQGFWRKTYSVAASMFYAAESLNRATALLAAYRAAQSPDAQAKLGRAYGNNENFKAVANKNGTVDPEAFAEFFSREVNFEGSRVNRPEALRGVGGVLLQFKSYPMNYISLLRKNATQMGPEGKMAFAMMMGMMIFAGGLGGLPFAEDFADLFDNVHKALTGDDPQTMATLQEAMADHGLGKLGAEAALKGFSPWATGMDLSRSLGMGNIAPRMADPLQLLGPTPAAILGGAYYGFQRLKSGQSAAAAAMEVAPRALKGPIQAAAVLPEEGLRTRGKGNIVIPPSEITTGQRAARTLGFQPADFAREYEARGRRQALMQAEMAKAGDLRGEYARLLALGIDYDNANRGKDAAKARADARKVAEEMASKGIKPPQGADLQKLIRQQLMPEESDIRRAPKRLREEVGKNPFPARGD